MFDTPGVIVQEVPGGVRPISGVSTSNTAFVGVFERGPVNEATRVTSFGEFSRMFGGLFQSSYASYAIRNYFLNGGAVAFVVRVAAGGAETASVDVALDGGNAVAISASSPGSWGNNIHLGVAHSDAPTTRFTLLVREFNDQGRVVREETFIDISTDDTNPRYAPNVLARDSELIRMADLSASPNQSSINGNSATSLDELLEAPQTDLVAVGDTTAGDDGQLPENTTNLGDELQNVFINDEATNGGIFALNTIVPEVFNILCIPDMMMLDTTAGTNAGNIVAVTQAAYAYCHTNFAFLLIDTPELLDRNDILSWTPTLGAAAGPNSAVYYPPVSAPDPLNPSATRIFPASGIAAGQYARTDATRGVWKAPAGTETAIAGGTPTDVMTDRQQGPLNTNGVNVFRIFPVYGSVIWGSRTLDGSDAEASEWKYVPVRRLALFIEASLQRGLQWVVFEPNDEPLWSNIRLNLTAFMTTLHRRGAFQGASARDAFLVKCDAETTTQADRNLGIVNILVGFAPVRPAEFVVLRIQQRTANAA